MENKEMYTKQLWVIKDLIEKRLNDMGETGVEVRVSK